MEAATEQLRRESARVGPAAAASLGLPNGWFAVATSEEIAPARVITRRFMSEDIVLYRTATGEARATAAHCPHLGAHLGHCGSVEGETLRCEFHGFRFDGEGACVATGYGKRPPPAARLGIKEVRERNGVVLVHHDPAWGLRRPRVGGPRAARLSRAGRSRCTVG